MADSMLYISIDFGTSYSGYAFSFKTKLPQEQIRIPSWGTEYGQKTFKTPTCILFDKDQQFLKFGYDAMITYTRSTRKDEAKKLCLFEHFKMELYDKEIHRDLMLTAKNGEKMKAMTVFSESLRYLKDHAMNKISSHTNQKKFTPSDVTWVLTVPAIWPAAAKQFMREAATVAGLVTEAASESLLLALEPEAASVFCKSLPSEGFIAEESCENRLEQNSGTQYMVVDCGGGTVDITVHEVVEGGHLKELHAASGNDMGGQTVDKKFLSFLREIFSEEIFIKFEQEYPAEALKLKYDIALVKACDEIVLIPCPVSLQDLARKKQSIESYFERVQGAEWDDGAILIKEQQLRSFFDDSLRATADKIRDIMSNTELKIDYIVLVGGFAECLILRQFMNKNFGSRCKVLCPAEPQVAIIKGAIMYGKQPKVVKSRVCGLTYGVCVTEPFDESVHKGKKKLVNSEGHEYCDGCFEKLVVKGESILCDEFRTFTFYPTDTSQTEATFQFYSTTRETVKFVDEWGVEVIGYFTVGTPGISQGLNREIRLEIQFGSTEMKATATDVGSQKTESIKLEFITK